MREGKTDQVFFSAKKKGEENRAEQKRTEEKRLHYVGHLSAVKAITAPPTAKCLKCTLACGAVASCPCDPETVTRRQPSTATNHRRQHAVKINMPQFCTTSA